MKSLDVRQLINCEGGIADRLDKRFGIDTRSKKPLLYRDYPTTVSGPHWQRADHLDKLAEKLEAVERGEIKRFIVTMPPRHGKSENISVLFPSWYLGKHPDNWIIDCGYGHTLAKGFSRRARNFLEERGEELFGVRVADDSSAADEWGIQGHRGGMIAAGIGGPITGKGANILIIDDPLKNAKEANSKVVRDAIWEWYVSTAYTRLTPDGAIILVLTRWHEDDLAGRLLKAAENDPDADQWEVLSLPALDEHGKALWPQKYNEKRLNKIKVNLGPYWWSALYQQKPQPPEGTLFKREWFRYFTEEQQYFILHTPDKEERIDRSACWIFQTCDPAATENERNDWFVLATWAVTPGKDLLLLDVLRTHAETTKHKQVMRAAFQRWSPSFQGVENKTFGLNIIQECKRDGLPIVPLKADTDKVSRARPMAARYEIGAVYHKQGAQWLDIYEDELLAFNRGANDDQVDCAAYAGIKIADEEIGYNEQPAFYL